MGLARPPGWDGPRPGSIPSEKSEFPKSPGHSPTILPTYSLIEPQPQSASDEYIKADLFTTEPASTERVNNGSVPADRFILCMREAGQVLIGLAQTKVNRR